jgi:glutaredoxin 3
MPRIVIYTSPFCGYCHRAKRVLKAKGAVFEEIDVMMEPARRDEMIVRSQGHATVPQVFIGDRHVGGHKELVALDQSGELDRLLDET